MQQIFLNIYYDRTHSSHFKLIVGDEWVRINIVNPGHGYDSSEKLTQIQTMLKTFMIVPRELRAITVDGPDMNEYLQFRGDCEMVIRNCWYDIWDRMSGGVPAAQLVVPAAQHPTVPHAAQHTAATAAIATEIDEITQIVINRINLYGAAPDFRSKKPGNKEKLINFIKSSSGNRNMSDHVAERVIFNVKAMYENSLLL